MALSERQYERLGRRLDGEEVRLNPAQQAAAGEIGAWEQTLAPAMDVPLPTGAIDRVRRRVAAELARPRRRALRVVYAAGTVAAAAAVIIAVALNWQAPPTRPPEAPSVAGPSGYAMAVLPPPAEPCPEIGALAREIEEFEAEMIPSAQPLGMDVELEQLRRDMDNFWLNGPSGELPDEYLP